MEVTEEKIKALIEGAKMVAKWNREHDGYSGQFTPVAIIVGPNGESTVTPMLFKDQREKEAIYAALTEAARRMHVLAIVLVSDTYHAKIKEFSAHFGIPMDLPFEEWEQRYLEILQTQFDGSLKNVPSHLVSDALLLAMKSPLFKQQVCFMPYHEGVGDSIRWDEEEPEHDAEIQLLKDWWDATPPN